MVRKTQVKPVPRLGGVAMSLAFSVVATTVLVLFGKPGDALLALGVLLPALGAAILGFVDDVRHLNPYLRLGVQGALATSLWFAGTRVEISSEPLLNFLITVLWVMVIVNGINLLDNSDGLAGSTVLLAASGAGFIAVLSGQELISVMAFALAGTALGFLWKNWFPARVYMGDAGSYFLGFLLAALIVRLRPETLSPQLALLVALLLGALPLADTVYVVTKRILNGTHPFVAGRDHLSHDLQGSGFSVPGSVAVLQASSLLMVALAAAIVILA
jgi:UDP-GlcNAc:undecaprenyl-phosphate GlcNAc-1-phosphate transferase